MARPKADNSSDVIDSPTAWFAALERARQTGDSELATRARRELDRLGVDVSFRDGGTRVGQGGQP